MNQKRKTVLKVATFWACFWLLLFVLRRIPVPLSPELGNLVFGIAGTLGALVLVRIFLRLDGKSFSDINLIRGRQTPVRFVFGVVVGIALVGVMLATVVLLAGLRVEAVPNPDYWDAIGFSILVLFALALMEEVAFRTYPLIELLDAIGVRTAIYATSFFFALYHGLDPANLLGPGVWGLLFGVTAIATRGIAFPLGFHFGLNWMQSLFGMKTQFASSVWTIAPGSGGGIISSELVGLILQLVLLAVGVLFIERYVRKS